MRPMRGIKHRKFAGSAIALEVLRTIHRLEEIEIHHAQNFWEGYLKRSREALIVRNGRGAQNRVGISVLNEQNWRGGCKTGSYSF